MQTAASIVTAPEKIESTLENGVQVNDGKPVTVAKIEIIENIVKPSTPTKTQSATTTAAIASPVAVTVTPTKSDVSDPKKSEPGKVAGDKSFVVTPDYIQQSMIDLPDDEPRHPIETI